MDRRIFLASSAALIALGPGMAFAGSETLEYKPGLLQQHLDRGDTVLLDFSASWCSTCAAQEKVLARLRDENPAYDRGITFIKVDWDTYGRATFATRMRIPRRSTLVLLRGDAELGRLVAETREDKLKALLEQAVTPSAY